MINDITNSTTNSTISKEKTIGYTYTVFQRKATKRWYCEIRFNNKIVKTITLKATIRREAVLEGKAYFDKYMTEQANKVQTNKTSDFIAAYCIDFWREDSMYALDKKIERNKKLSRAYLYNNRLKAEKELKEFFSTITFSELSTDAIKNMLRKLDERGYSQRHKNAVLHALKVPYNYYCSNHEEIRQIVIKKVKEERKERGALTIDEVRRIVQLQYPDVRIKCAILLGCLCGLRAGEIRGLKWQDVSESDGIITIKHSYVDTEGLKSTKTDRARTVPLPALLIPCLKEVARIHGKWSENFVLQSIKKDVAGAPISKAALERGFIKVLEMVGITQTERKKRNICFHSLRHTFITLARHLGISGVVVQKIAGHSTESMTDNYTHADITSIKTAGHVLDDALMLKASME